MSLTDRRKQFLKAIQDTYTATGKPIHYEDIARLLGVSKWTAYDMVRELAKLGLVSIEYVTNQNKKQVGRSRLAIRPVVSSSSIDLIKEESTKILQTLQESKPSAALKHFHIFMQRATASDSKEMFCLYLIAALVTLSNRLIREKGLLSILNTIFTLSNTQLGLITALGVMVGLIIRGGLNFEVKKLLREAVACFQEYIGEMTDEEHQSITVFWQKALNVNYAETQ